MYTNPQKGAAVVAAAHTQATRLAQLRFMVLDTVNYSPYATAEEKAKTAASVAACQSAETLVKWYCNLLTLLSERELAAPTATAAVEYATGEQKQQLIRLLNHPAVARSLKTKVLLTINRLLFDRAVALIAELKALAATPSTRPAGAGLVVNRRGQLAVAALTGYARKAVSYVQAA